MPRQVPITALVAIFLAAAPAHSQRFYDASNLLPPPDGDIALGASVVDVNGDGLVDLYRKNRVLLQEDDGTFTNVFTEFGYTMREGGSFGALFADANNDGYLETFFMDLDESLPYYLGHAGLYAEEHSNDSGIRNIEIVQGSAFTDFNRDGLLDLFVGIDGGRPRLYRNVGLDFFQNVAATAGLDDRYAYGVAAADFDRDGDPDVMLTQCFPPQGDSLQQNVLWRNDDGYFVNASVELGIVDDLPSWGVVWLDYDNDGLLDFYIGNNKSAARSLGKNTLYRNLGGGGFEDVSAQAGVEQGDASHTIAVAAADFDNDGWIDLFATEAAGGQPAFFRNNGDGTFTERWPQLALPAINSNAVAVGDVNGDGWIDIFHPSMFGDQLFINLGGDNHYLTVSLRGVASNHFGVGGRIDLYAGGLHQVREITAGDGMTSQNHNLSAHFGLGQATAVDSIVVHWPSGLVDRLTNLTTDRTITVVEGIGANDPPSAFRLLRPLSKDALSPSSEVLELAWERPTDTDMLEYTLHIRGAGLDSATVGIAEERFTIDRSLFQNGRRYRWTVAATDGHSVRTARYDDFVFGPTTSNEGDTELPAAVRRFEVFPNPATIRSNVVLETVDATEVTLDVFDALGRRVERLYDGILPAGSLTTGWNVADVAPGMYIVEATATTWSITRPIVVQ